MKRINVVGMCLLAVFALCAIAASSASAKKPVVEDQPYTGPAEWGVCVKVKKTGKYTDPNCVSYYAVNKVLMSKGNYEWHSADECYAQKKGKYDAGCKEKVKKGGVAELAPSPTYVSTSGEGKLVSGPPLSGEVKCKANTDEGQITGDFTDVDFVKFTGCETLGFPCENTATVGEIDTYLLETELIQSEPGEAYNKFVNAHGAGAPYSAIFGCEHVGYFRTKGSTAGKVTPTNTSGTSSETSFTAGNGQQELVTEYSETGAPGSWTGELYGPAGEAASEEIITAKTTDSTAIELRTGEERAEVANENETTGEEKQKGHIEKISPPEKTDTLYKTVWTWKVAVEVKKNKLDVVKGNIWEQVTECGKGLYLPGDTCITRVLIECLKENEELKAVQLLEVGAGVFAMVTLEGKCLKK